MRMRFPLASLLAMAALSLTAAAPTHAAAAQATGQITYNVQIRVCDFGGSGTDDNVWGRLRDTSGAVSSWVLFDKSGYNDFEAGDNDTYQVPTPAGFGDLAEIDIEKDGSNGLCLNRIEVKAVGSTEPSGFWQHSSSTAWWLDQEEDCSGDASSTCLGNKHAYPLKEDMQ
ncbi:PLAT/LH2 domain-containing protein [Streptomyces sp. SID4982]|uniref:PLAT/LH2 domain-containing protein n=1 Tax=Streptomyces sp. SID4982 TaxID=2690291 RepID=UPI00136B1331|nr:PLAT/LH2 domain-containing protein [Streptomyces sp. SID4982]MYS16684.1 hypothetical protein [Streptomyces sp. SID4982]